MNPFDQFMNDVMTIRKKDGTSNGPHKCDFQGTEIFINDSSIDVDEGDTVERELPNKKVEKYRVLEAEFTKGGHMIPEGYRLVVRKDTSLRAVGGRTTNIHIESAHGIQIGDHNVQQISAALHSLVNAVEESNAAQQEKQEVKNLIERVLRHPAVAAVVGAGAGALAKSVLGG